MKFSGWQRTSLIDFPDRISTVLFTQGCSMRCRFCHNPELVTPTKPVEGQFLEADVFTYLEKRKKMLEGVVITGGEPTIQKKLAPFIQKIKNMGYSVKLDTNGYQPDTLHELLSTGTIDYVAMDVKAPLHKYSYVTGVPIDSSRIQQSLSLLASSGIPYELRTTAAKPLLSIEDLHTIAKEIYGAPIWFIQQFRSSCTLDTALLNQDSYKDEELQQFVEQARQLYGQNCRMR